MKMVFLAFKRKCTAYKLGVSFNYKLIIFCKPPRERVLINLYDFSNDY